jgi:hypothetical protein
MRRSGAVKRLGMVAAIVILCALQATQDIARAGRWC